MSIAELIKSGANVTLAITASDLKEWHREVIEDTKRQLEEAIVSDKAETYLSAKQVCEMLNIDTSTLWRWQNKGYLMPSMAGGKRRYKYSEIKELLSQRSK